MENRKKKPLVAGKLAQEKTGRVLHVASELKPQNHEVDNMRQMVMSSSCNTSIHIYIGFK